MPLSAPQMAMGPWVLSPSHEGRGGGGYAPSFEQARTAFENAWQGYLARCTEADFAEHRRQRDWTAKKYAMHERGERMPTGAEHDDALPCGETFNSHRLECTLVHVPHITAAQARDQTGEPLDPDLAAGILSMISRSDRRSTKNKP
jgi:hypothetical protein